MSTFAEFWIWPVLYNLLGYYNACLFLALEVQLNCMF